MATRKSATKPAEDTGTKNLPAVAAAQLPMNWEEEMAKEAVAVATAEAKVGGSKSFSIKAGILSYGGSPIPGGKMKVVVLASAFANRFYTEGYDPNEIVPPSCFSFSETGEDMVPHEKAQDKQAETCAECPHSRWGSAVDNKGKPTNGKACRNSRTLVLISADKLDAATAASTESATLSIPATSLTAWGSYVKAVSGAYKRPPYGVITEVSVQPDAAKQVSVTFTLVEPIRSREVLAEIYNRKAQALEEAMRPYEPRSEEPAKPAAKKAVSKRKY
ncbi:hypothetical protein UFOVP435_79 [uncultured Caudovirales phage]|uniref:Uncharacterized protein n=1 Tax=uncultured Caudovirales phage TaxID=2100421 RepID=A0A6J5M968_9CAUD|nr:hypothetical protein UFOVP435_79 [uncultured Caudovirales phage]